MRCHVRGGRSMVVSKRTRTVGRCFRQRALLKMAMDDSGRTSAQEDVAAHLESCERCREELKELRRLTGDLKEGLDLGLFDVVPVEPRKIVVSGPRTWSVAAMVVVAALLVFGVISEDATTVNAETLLSNGLTYERTLPRGYERHVHATLVLDGHEALADASVTPFDDVWLLRDGRIEGSRASEGNDVRGLRLALAAHYLDPEQPLSVGPIQEWRASLASKRDDLTVNGDLAILRTRTSVGRVQEVVVTIQGHRVRRVSIVIAGLGRFSCEEVAVSARHDEPARAPSPTTPSVTPSKPRATTHESTRRVAPWLAYRLENSRNPRAFVPGLERGFTMVGSRLDALQQASAERVPSSPEASVSTDYDALLPELRNLEGHLLLVIGSVRHYCRASGRVPADWAERIPAAKDQLRALKEDTQRFLSHDASPSQTELGVARARFEAVWKVMDCQGSVEALR